MSHDAEEAFLVVWQGGRLVLLSLRKHEIRGIIAITDMPIITASSPTKQPSTGALLCKLDRYVALNLDRYLAPWAGLPHEKQWQGALE
jgi:hypothetical protein